MEGPMPDPSTLDAEGDDDVVSPIKDRSLFLQKTMLMYFI